ncbi:Transposon TX1 uncharacterized 149 kDa protein [Linum perenne]
MQLLEHRSIGPWFTWSNKRVADPIARRLDRVFVNEDWLDSFKSSLVTILPPGFSDHCSLLVNTDIHLKFLPKPFKYFKYWCAHPEFYPLVEKAWCLSFSGSVLAGVSKKLRNLKGLLKKLFRDHYSDTGERVKAVELNLQTAQSISLDYPSSISFQEVARLSSVLHDLKRIEEDFFRLKACIDWVSSGDLNTSYFHKSVKLRLARSSIRQLISDSGETVTEIEQMAKIAVDIYSKLLGEADQNVLKVDHSLFDILISKKLSTNQATDLCCPITLEEVRDVFFSMARIKLPALMGFQLSSFILLGVRWVKTSIMVIWSFFLAVPLPLEVNSNILTLIPKVPNAEHMKYFRPISCVNVVYKGLAKLIANRLRQVLPDIISPNQSAFIKIG